MHGFLGLPSDWEGFNVKAVPIEAFSDMYTWAKHFNEQVKQEGAKKNRLIGYSMGGRLASYAAAQAPELWERVWLISTHPGLNSGFEGRIEKDEVWANKFENQEWFSLMAEWMAQPVFFGSSAPLRMPSDFDRKTLVAYLRNYSLGRQKITPPDKVGWIVGEKDEIYRELLPKALVIKDAGHRVMFDNPKALKLLCEI